MTMSLSSQQWGEFLSCPVCYNMFNDSHHQPISLACSHSLCRACLHVKLQQRKCPFDHTPITRNLDDMPVNSALLQLVGVTLPESVKNEHRPVDAEEARHYVTARNLIENFANYLKPMITGTVTTSTLSRPILKKLITLINCQLIEEEGRSRLVKIARSIGERTITEMILQHQNPQQLSANLWAAVRTRGCQFLGPAMQEEVLKLILLALEDGSALTRKVLVLFVVQRLQAQYPQASKTAIGHVVQLLYRASCFMVTKREEESSLMQLKEEFRTYEGLRREHDAQIVQIATEAGLRIAPDQWSSLLYGDTQHKSHMQSIIDKLQTPQSFSQAVNELSLALQRSGDPSKLGHLSQYFEMLAAVDPTQEASIPSMEDTANILIALQRVVEGLAEFCKITSHKKVEPLPAQNTKFKTSMCRNYMQTGTCPRGSSCTFAHTKEEMERHRAKARKLTRNLAAGENLTEQELEELEMVSRTVADRLQARNSFSEDGSFEHDSHLDDAISPPRSSLSPVSGAAGVKVPTVQTPVMPVAKGTPTSYMQGIYSGPKHVMTPEDHRHHARIGSGGHTKVQGQPHPPHHHSRTTESNTHTVMTVQAGGKPSVALYSSSMGMQPQVHPTYWNVEDPYLRAVLSYTRHPYIDAYTGRIPGLEWGFKPESAISACMGRSQREQLDELRRRRVDILQQMNKTKQSAGVPETAMPPELEPSPASKLLARSVSDTIATSLTTAAHSRVENKPTITSSPPGTSSTESWSQHSPDHTSETSTSSTTSSASHSMEASTPPQEACTEDVTKPSSGTDDSRVADWVWMHPGMGTHPSSGISCKIREECDDEFIPFSEHTMVSKYGPISRGVRAKSIRGGPVQVTAPQGKGTTPVTAVTPVERPYPITSPVPSHFLPTDHIPDPRGPAVASSLPTAILKPNLMVPMSSQHSDLRTLVQEQYPDPEVGSPRKSSGKPDLGRMEPEKLNHELAQVTRQIQSLQTSEDDRLARELQTVEMDILETQRKLTFDYRPTLLPGPSNPYHMTTLPHQASSLRDHEMAPAGLGHHSDVGKPLHDAKAGQNQHKPTVTVAPQVARPPQHL